MKKLHQTVSRGRSMLEMLGVLAIIGLLSVAALAGFTYAMNKHKANETIHDVMLRASNVPMIDEFYTQRTGDYEWMFAGLPDSGQTGSFYTMNTWVSDINGYIYRVVVSDVPKRVCRQILALDPTDIDAIYVEGDKPTDDECPNEVNRMAFYFDEYGTGGHLPDIDKPDPDDPNPDNPDPSRPICIGSDCDENGQCTGPDCTICVGSDCDADGNCIGPNCSSCTGRDCGPDGECTGPDCESNDYAECSPACGSCEECVNGSCHVKTCEIESCPEGQTSTGTDACGCIIDCQEKCPGLTCEDCEVPNYETCTCDADPDPCCGLEGAALSCCQGGLTCGECAVPNYETCTCDYDPACCPEFTGCSGCTTETTDENGCRVCSSDQSVQISGGSCCLEQVSCCPLTETCTERCTPSSECDECGEGELVEIVTEQDGTTYCCLSSSSIASCGICNPVYHVPGETTASCEGCPVGLYERDNGLWIDCVECTQDSHCDTNNCEACVSNQCQSKCETGQTCNGKGSCCSNGVGNDGTCCAELTSTDCDTEIDDNGCSVCKQGCDPDTQQSCTNGTDTWCCDVGQMCGNKIGVCDECNAKSAENDETLCKKCGWDWTYAAYWKGEPYYDPLCGGTAFCRARYGTANWDLMQQNGDFYYYACAGDGYCKDQYGAGSWGLQKKDPSQNLVWYGCTGDDYCQAIDMGGCWVQDPDGDDTGTYVSYGCGACSG